MKINVFDIKFKTNPNQSIAIAKDPFVLEVPDVDDINSYIASWFNETYNAVPTFDWELLDESESGKLDEIRAVLRRYFECNDNGDPNPEYDEIFEPQSALDAIHEIIGKI